MARKKTRGDLFRAAVQESYEINRPDEVELVEEAARLLDLVDGLDKAVAESGYVGVGSMGQPVVSPVLTALQTARSELRQVLRQICLPDPETTDG